MTTRLRQADTVPRARLVAPAPAGAPAQPGFDPKIVVIIPVFKHSVFLGESIQAVLEQLAPFDVATVIVDDGCPFPETATLAASYALSEPSVFYLRKPNGGLSSARNFGIAFALAQFPGFEAVYFLDSDNRISPTTLDSCLSLLRATPDADWVYPNIDKFGSEWSGNYTAEYSRLLHITFDNICEAGSLVSRRMLEKGARFDENMKAGCEDWEFWLQGLAMGMRGINNRFFGFEYRMRGESMISDTARDIAAVRDYMKKKHQKLFAQRNLMQLEHAEAPRFACMVPGTPDVLLFTDPAVNPVTISQGEFLGRMRAGLMEPDSFGTPHRLLWFKREALDMLIATGLVWTVLNQIEKSGPRYHFIAIQCEHSTSEITVSLEDVGAEHPLGRPLQGWSCMRGLFADCVADQQGSWAATLNSSRPAPLVGQLTVRGPFSARRLLQASISATGSILASIGQARTSGMLEQPVQRWNWREAYFPDYDRRSGIVNAGGTTEFAMPRLASASRIQIGIALPITSYGGVEKVAYALSAALRSAGCDVHLFCFGKPQVALQAGQTLPFASINFFAEKDYALWGGSRPFMGHDLRMEYDGAAMTARVVGFLSGMDVLINCQVAPLHAAAGALRRQGMKIVSHMHVTDATAFGRPTGHPYLGLGFEHAHDVFLTCSQAMLHWLHAMGVPLEKLRFIENAPGYALSHETLTAALQRRRAPTAGAPLRIVFVGRLDAQKGIDRLIAAIRIARKQGLNATWRVIGSEVVHAGQSGASWKEELTAAGVTLEPPIYDAAKLSDIYVESDVLVLTSRWEGAPLTIIEAQRLGCLPVATAVGAVDELIHHGVDGLLLDGKTDADIVAQLVEAVRLLDKNRQKLAKMRNNAITRGNRANWMTSAAPLLELLERWYPGRMGATS